MSEHGDGEPGKLTEEEDAEIAALCAQQHAKFTEIMSFIARTLGYDPANLSAAEQQEVRTEAEEACEQYDEADVDTPLLLAGTPLQLLLQEHNDLGALILNIEDTAIGRDLGDVA